MIYEPLGDDGYEICLPVKSSDFERIHDEIDGTPRSRGWKPIRMELIGENMGRRLTRSDSPWFGSDALVFRPRALQVLEPLLTDYGELLPLECDDAELVMYNPTCVIDALDREKCSFERFSDGTIWSINPFIFRPEAIANVDIFKIPDLRASPTFLSQRFVDCWQISGLEGLEFINAAGPKPF